MKGLAFNLTVVAAAFAVGNASAAGFALQNQNGAGTGNAFAGAAAAAEDASTVYFNPAGMLLLPTGHNFTGALTFINRSVDYSDRGTAPLGPFAPGRNGGDGGGLSIVPAAYWSYAIRPDLAVGVGVGPTFGNKTEFDRNFIGRFSGYFAEIKQININPSIAYKLNDRVALGFGLNFVKNETEFKQMAPLAAGLPIGVPVSIKGDDTAFGWNAGLMIQATPSTRVGITYRSKLSFDLEGTQKVSGGPTFDVKAKLKTPDQVSLAVLHAVDSKLELLADLTWTGWRSIDSIQVRGGTNPELAYHFKDTWRVGLGLGYQMNDQWKLRAGVAFDEAPVRSAADRTMTLPDTDRTWLSLGGRYTLNKNASIDLGYSHIFFKKGATERIVYNGNTPLQQIKGKFEVGADLLSLQYNHNF